MMRSLLSIAMLLAGCATMPADLSGRAANPIVRCLSHAELQAETAEQTQRLAAALDEMARLPITELKQRRYADYQGAPGQWDLPTLLGRHFVPEGPCDYRTQFWQSLADPEARALARRMAPSLDTWNRDHVR